MKTMSTVDQRVQETQLRLVEVFCEQIAHA
jgi:hypothetical protein